MCFPANLSDLLLIILPSFNADGAQVHVWVLCGALFFELVEVQQALTVWKINMGSDNIDIGYWILGIEYNILDDVWNIGWRVSFCIVVLLGTISLYNMFRNIVCRQMCNELTFAWVGIHSFEIFFVKCPAHFWDQELWVYLAVASFPQNGAFDGVEDESVLLVLGSDRKIFFLGLEFGIASHYVLKI